MSGPIGIALERTNGPDRAAGRPLWGDVGQILVRVLGQYGVNVERDCIVAYAVTDQGKGRSIDLVKPNIERIQTELAPCSKILCCGALAVAAVYPTDTVPLKYHKKRGLGVMSSWGSPSKFLVPTYSLQQIWAEPEYYRDFHFDVQKIVHQDAPQPEPLVDTVVVQTLEQARVELNKLRGANIIACDIETEPGPGVPVNTDDERKQASLDPLRARISCIGFGVMYRDDGRRGYAVVIPRHLLYPKSQDMCQLLLSFLGAQSTYKGIVVWQNFTFDAQHLRVYLGEWPFHPNTTDTLMMNYALDERPIGRFGVHSLKDMARYRFDRDYGFNWDNKDDKAADENADEQLYQYNGEDCFHTARLYEVLRAEMETEPGLENLVANLLMPASTALAQVSRKGILIDQIYLANYCEELQTRVGEQAQKLQEFAAQNGVPSFDASSPQQVAKFLFDTLGIAMPNVRLKDKKPGAWSTQKLVLDKVRRTCTEEQRTFLDNLIAYRLYTMTRNTFVKGLQKQISVDGRIHPNLLLAGTATGRLSSFSPNLQNQPVHTAKEIRKSIIAPPGYTLIEADHKNLELRVTAYFSQEPVLVDAFRRDADLHREVAAKVFGKKVEDVTDHERFLAKAVNFGLIYGRSAEALAEGREMDEYEARGGTRWTLEIARQFHDDYLNSMPVLKQWIKDQTAQRFAAKHTLTPYGRMRRFPLVLPHTRGEVERQIINSEIQSTASDITLEGLIRLVSVLPEGAWIILTIHDSVLLECRNDLVSSVSSLICDVMEHPSLLDRGVPWKVDIHTARNWADIKD